MQFSTTFALVAALAGSAVAAPAANDNQCVANYSNCFSDITGQFLGSCCEGLICVANRCRDPKELTPKENTCIVNYQNCFSDTTGQSLGACCDGLICVANRCRDPKELITNKGEQQCLKENADCFSHTGQPLGACCDGLICAADKCRNPKL